MSRTCRALATLGGAAALVVTGMSPASAAYWRHDDAVGDVVSQTQTFDGETGDADAGEPFVDPANTDTDITRLTVDNRKHRVVLRTTLRDLTVDSGVVVYYVRTSTRQFSVMQRLGTDRAAWPAFALTRENGATIRCAGVTRSVKRDVERATVSIPRSCLGRPGWVRVGAGVVKFDVATDEATISLDQAMREADAVDDLVMGPRVRRD